MRSGKNRKGCVIGLTGGIGSGKSTVLALFKKKGAFTLDSDAIVHRLQKQKTVLNAIKREFGSGVFAAGGELDRKKLAAVVFSSPARKKKLERMIHPLVRKEIYGRLKRRKGNVTVVDVPLLYESGWKNEFDRVIVVNAALKNRVRRLKQKGFDAADIRRRIKAQWSLAKKARLADFVVDNNGPLARTKKQIDPIWNQITGRN
jgi:dephospho-CoA kinase